MDTAILNDFVSSALSNCRIRFGDVRRLQRGLATPAVKTRAEVEILLTLDRSIAKADPSWLDFLATAVSDFVIEASASFDGDAADTIAWLYDALVGQSARTTAAILRHLSLRLPSDARPGLALFDAPRKAARGSSRQPRELEIAEAPGVAPSPGGDDFASETAILDEMVDAMAAS